MTDRTRLWAVGVNPSDSVSVTGYQTEQPTAAGSDTDVEPPTVTDLEPLWSCYYRHKITEYVDEGHGPEIL